MSARGNHHLNAAARTLRTKPPLPYERLPTSHTAFFFAGKAAASLMNRVRKSPGTMPGAQILYQYRLQNRKIIQVSV